MLKTIKLQLIIYTLCLVTSISNSNNLECKNEMNGIICDYIISVQKNNASDLGTYNININMIKIKEIAGIFNANMSISAGLCDNVLETRIKEKIQIAQSLNNQSYNFPLYLHKQDIIADFCVELLIDNCID